MSHDRFDDEDGLALISVLFAVLVLTGLATLFVSRSMNESRFSAQSQRFETGIHAAEAGADVELAQANGDEAYLTEDLTGDPYPLDLTGMSLDAQRDQVIDWALAAHGEGITTARDGGTYFGVRPQDSSVSPSVPHDIIYGVSFVPALPPLIDDRAEIPERTTIRVVKYSIAQDLYTPVFALHTDGSLKFGGNASITSDGCDPAAPDENCDADVQVNGSLTNPGGSSSVQGEVRVAGGSCPSITATGGCVDTSDGVAVDPAPRITARQFYSRHDEDFNPDQGNQTVQWYDLCPDGKVYAPHDSGPCYVGQDPVWPSAGQTNFLGWVYQAGKWKATSVSAGVFYVYQEDAEVNGSDAGSDPALPRAVTIFVEGDPDNSTSTGSLTITGNPKLEAAFPDVLFIADRDIRLKGVASGGTSEYSGFISAYEQLDAGGTVVLNGAILVQDREDVHPEVTRNTATVDGNMTLNYDRTLAINLTGYYTITHWSEL